MDALIGREAVVVKAIKPFEPGLIKLSGQEWTAVCRDDDAPLEEGAEVKVIGIEGVKAIVSPSETAGGERWIILSAILLLQL